MYNITLRELKGTWISDSLLSPKGSMWISDDETNIFVNVGPGITISENIDFTYDKENNGWTLSKSVFLSQLMPDDDIVVKIKIENNQIQLVLKRR